MDREKIRELGENYINGNISDTRKKLGNKVGLALMVAEELRTNYGMEEYLTFIRLMSI